MPVTEADVRAAALSLPATTEKPSYGTPGFRVKDRLFARVHDLPSTLVVWVADMAEKEALLASSPDRAMPWLLLLDTARSKPLRPLQAVECPAEDPWHLGYISAFGSLPERPDAESLASFVNQRSEAVTWHRQEKSRVL